jgi:predicted Zn-dependent protease
MDKGLLNNPKKAIFLLGSVLFLIFILVFHKEDQLKELLKLTKPDHISILYLKLLLNITPDNDNLRVELARHYINLGEENNARTELDSVITKQNSTEELHARILMLGIDFKSYFSIPENDPAREKTLAKLQNDIFEISKKDLPTDLIDKVIQLSLELNQPHVAANLYYNWAKISLSTAVQIEKLKESARWYIAAGLPEKAAEIYHESSQLSVTPTQAKQFAFKALDTLQSIGNSQRAFEYFQSYQQRFPENPELLEKAIDIALASGNPKEAYQLGILRLGFDPDNPEQIRKQFDRALATGEIQAAFALTQQLIEITPEDEGIHENLAKIAGWLNNPKLALNEWLWLARNRKDEESIQNAIALSNELKIFDNVIELLEQQSSLRELSINELDNLSYSYKQKNQISRFISFLNSYVKRYPKNFQTWELLAKTYENNQQVNQAIEIWQQIGKRFNRPLDAVTNHARILWQNNQPQKALDVLLQNQQAVTEKDLNFWEIFAQISWDLKETKHALRANNILWLAESTNTLVPERLIQLNRNSDKGKEAIAVGEQTYYRFNDPRWLLLAMDVANQFGLVSDLKRLLKLASSNESQFLDLEMYWLLNAQLAILEQNPNNALKHYEQALRINPASLTAKEGILWNLIDHNNLQTLQHYLKKWRKDASKTPQLWGVYGIGLTKVGKTEEALAWLERKARKNSADYLWTLAYADALDSIGRVDDALKIRRHALLNIRSDFNNKNHSDDSIKQLLHPQYLALIRAQEGADTEISILKQTLAKGYGDSVVQELLVSAYLIQNNSSAARFWLLKNHIERQKTPAWQRLSLALAEKDAVSAQNILQNEGTKLSTFNALEALKLQNKNAQALKLTYGLLESNKDTSLQANLFQTRDDLALKLSKQFTTGFDYKSLGDINFMESRARLSVPYSQANIAFDFKHTLFNAERFDLILPAQNEIDIASEFRYPFQQGVFQGNFGGNLRNDQSLPYGGFRVNYDLTSRLRANMRLGINEMSHETGVFRALGAKDTILLGVTSQLAHPLFFNVEVDGHRYSTREGNTLGKGYKVQSIVGASLVSSGNHNWQVRMQGSWEDNQLASTLPVELVGLLGAGKEQIETLIPRKFGMLGLGTAIRIGSPDQTMLRRPFLLVDAWSGWVWPANAIGYNGRVSAGISLFGPDILSVGAFYSNVQGGRTNQAFTGVGVQYLMRF